MFKDYLTYPKQTVSPSILWEYDTKSPSWNWNDMAVIVMQCVIQYGNENDYYAALLYGGFEKISEIVKKIPSLSDKDLNWACFLFNVKKEDTLCFTRKSLRKRVADCADQQVN